MIKAIIFDMGNVLITYNPAYILNSLSVPLDDQPLIQEAIFSSAEWQLSDTGAVTHTEVAAGAKSRLPDRFHPLVDEIMSHWHEHMLPIEGAETFVAKLKQKGYKLYLLSNASVQFDTYSAKHTVFSLFDGLVISSREKVVKPNKEIYQRLLERYQLEPSECIFIDDLADNVRGAQLCGIEAIVFDGDYSKLTQLFTEKGLL